MAGTIYLSLIFYYVLALSNYVDQKDTWRNLSLDACYAMFCLSLPRKSDISQLLKYNKINHQYANHDESTHEYGP